MKGGRGDEDSSAAEIGDGDGETASLLLADDRDAAGVSYDNCDGNGGRIVRLLPGTSASEWKHRWAIAVFCGALSLSVLVAAIVVLRGVARGPVGDVVLLDDPSGLPHKRPTGSDSHPTGTALHQDAEGGDSSSPPRPTGSDIHPTDTALHQDAEGGDSSSPPEERRPPPDDLRISSTTSGGLRYSLSNRAGQQAEQFRLGSGLLLNVHITHHAGTTMCGTIGRAVGAPRFVCMGVKPEDNVTDPGYPKSNPWPRLDTAKNIAIVRRYFRYVSWEYNKAPKLPLSETDWENPALVSILVVRDPMR